MAKSGTWPAFTAGAAFGALVMAGVLSYRKTIASGEGRVVHVERSINIGRPVETLFSSWMNLERMPHLIGLVRKVDRTGAGSLWVADLDGHEVEFDATVTQLIFNESIGWKSMRGPRHSGRISFSPLGDQTVVHVMMSYAPPASTSGSLADIGANLEQWIDRGLREFKASMEDDSLRREPRARTGTTGAEVESSWSYTRPPKDK